MSFVNKTTLKGQISAVVGWSSTQKTILSNMVDSYVDLFSELTTVQRNLLTPTLGLIIFNTDVAGYEYYNGSLWLPLGGNINTPMTVRVDLSSADLLALNTTGIVVCAAPGSGYAAIPATMAYRFSFGSIAYANATGGTQNVNLLHSSSNLASVQPYMTIPDTVIKAAADRSGVVVANSGSSANTIVGNDSLILKANQAFITGDGTLTVWVTFSLIAY